MPVGPIVPQTVESLTADDPDNDSSEHSDCESDAGRDESVDDMEARVFGDSFSSEGETHGVRFSDVHIDSGEDSSQ